MLTELRPKKDLIDPNFGGYKLSLDTIPVYQHKITEDVDRVHQSEDQYSFVHTKVFSLHNHLFGDPWQNNVVYFIDKTWKVYKAAVSADSGRLEDVKCVWAVPNLKERKIGHFNISLVFPSAEIAVLADGCGWLYLLNRVKSPQWQSELIHKEPEADAGSLLMTARLSTDYSLHCVLMTLQALAPDSVTECEAAQSEKPKPANIKTVLCWNTFSKESNGEWNNSCKRQIEGTGTVDYVELEVSCSALYICSNETFKFTVDSANPLPLPQEKMETENDELKQLYTWEQTSEDLKVVLELGEDVTRDSVDVSVKKMELSVQCQQMPVLSGTLHQLVDEDLTTWTLEQGRLEISLTKLHSGQMWPELLKGDQRGYQVLDPALVKDVNSRLSHLCSNSEVRESGEGLAPTFNLDQLEECDSAPEDSRSLIRLDSSTHAVSHQISLAGHQWLTSVRVSPDCAPCVCVRHDVDGCVWQLDPPVPSTTPDWPCEHIATFSALGYVAASKQQKKFIIASPDLSYAVICEASNHVFLYRKASIVNGELRNRRTSAKVPTVAKQQLINLESQSPVLGAHASNTHLFVLTLETLFVFHVQTT